MSINRHIKSSLLCLILFFSPGSFSSAFAQVLLTDNFNDGNFTGWTIVDEGTVNAPSVWSASTGQMVHSSNIHDGNVDPAVLAKRGTFAWYGNGLGWSDYQVGLTLRSEDQDALGVMVRYQDPDNYYRFSWDRWRGYRRLVKVENGVFSLMAEDSVVYTEGQTYSIDIIANGDTLEVWIDGGQVFAVTDSGTTLTSGSVALYNWANNGGYFDNVVVDTIGTPPPTLPISDDFNDGNFIGWTAVDEGTISAPSAWSAATGTLVQSSNIYGGSTNGSVLPKPGTFLFYTNGSTWTDYQATFTMRSTDDDAVGMMVRYQDPNNYYRFSWDRQRTYRRLVKVENGVFSVLAQDSVAYTKGQTYAVDIQANGDTLLVSIDGVQVFAVTDGGTTLTTGSVALYSWANSGSFFDNVVVDTVGAPLQTLTVSVNGNGTVTSSPGGIDCPGDCTEAFTGGQSVTLTATPDAGATFLNWSGDCTGTSSTCVVPMTQARAVTAAFEVTPPQTLTVSVNGNGTVTSSPGGIDCPGDCTEAFTDGQSVTLTATPDAGATFLNWSGDCTGTSSTCVVPMTQARTVTAAFDVTPPPTFPISDDFNDGNFIGWTAVDEGTISAPSAWSAATGTLVQSSNIYGGSTNGSVLPKPGTFLFYTNGSTWTDYQATFTMRSTDDDAVGMMVRYQDPNNYYRFSWDRQRTYRRLVKVENGVFSVLAQDSVAYTKGQTYAVDIQANGDTLLVSIDGVQVFAVTDGGTTLTTGSVALYSWANSGSFFDNVVVDTVGAPLQTLTVSVNGNGTVTSSPGGIDCPGDCTEAFTGGQSVTLTATPDAGATFLNWSGDCTGTSSTCVVPMTQARAVTAAFEVTSPPTQLLSDDFNDGNFTGWTVVDEGTVNAPSVWSAASGQLVHSSNIHDGILDPAVLAKRGTFAWYGNGLGWSDYQVGLTLRSQDQDALGVMFRYQDPNNYYRFSWDRWRNYRRLVKVENGVFSLLAQDSVVYNVGQTYAMDVKAFGDRVEVWIDGNQVFAVTDGGTALTSGSIALYNWGNKGSHFDNVVVSAQDLQISSPQELDVITSSLVPIPATIAVTIQTVAIGIPSNGGVEFVVDGDDLNAVEDYTAPFELVTNLVPAEHTVTVYMIDSGGNRIQPNISDEVNFGVGDYYVGFGDSITSETGNHDDIPGDDTSSDGRNTGGGYQPILNDLLTNAKGYSHTVENEGVSGDESIDGVNRIASALAAHPNSNYFLILFGTNDSFLPVPSGQGINCTGLDLPSNDPGCPGTFKDNLQKIINAIVQSGKGPLLSKVPIRYGNCGGPSQCSPFPNAPTASENLFIDQQYNVAIDELRSFNSIEGALGNPLNPPDIYSYFEGTAVDGSGKSVEFDDFLHPNGTGYQSIANEWLDALTE